MLHSSSHLLSCYQLSPVLNPRDQLRPLLHAQLWQPLFPSLATIADTTRRIDNKVCKVHTLRKLKDLFVGHG
jgi:hypothetical protein